MTDINAIKSRLGSLSISATAALPHAVQKLLIEDMPLLIDIAKEADIAMKSAPSMDFTMLLRALRHFHEY
jgi:hypothetical protein